MATSELRISVGTFGARRSTVWKFVVNKNEAYIMTRLFAHEAKVSLHGDGWCQWSRYDSWVTALPGRKNADRHITRWHMPRPNGNGALLAFMARIPESELRVMGDDESLANVTWLPPAPAGSTTTLACYITRPSDDDPSLASSLPHRRVWSARLSDGRWFVILHVVESISMPDLERLREAAIASAHAQGLTELLPTHRACMWAEGDGGITRSILEIAVTGE